MFIIWSRLGILVPVAAFASAFAINSFFDRIFGAGYYKMHSAPKFIAGIVGGIFIFMVGQWLNSKDDVYESEQDPKTRKVTFVKRYRHTLFFVPFEYWGIVHFIICLFAAIGPQR